MTCAFCRIVAGDLPSSLVYDDDRALAFMDLSPATPGHLLVVPRRHATDLAELHPDDGPDRGAVPEPVSPRARPACRRHSGRSRLTDSAPYAAAVAPTRRSPALQ
ncbi:MAG TPA: HIT domain-containing protein [Nocardioides sp.]|nr:HIT domain-containing protein [Nocardioides sp.]